jgi:hypothetical protein
MSGETENKREFTRVRIHVEVEVSTDDRASISGKVEDLSLNGAYVPCTGRLPVGTQCKVELILDGQNIRLIAEAVVTPARVCDSPKAGAYVLLAQYVSA